MQGGNDDPTIPGRKLGDLPARDADARDVRNIALVVLATCRQLEELGRGLLAAVEELRRIAASMQPPPAPPDLDLLDP